MPSLKTFIPLGCAMACVWLLAGTAQAAQPAQPKGPGAHATAAPAVKAAFGQPITEAELASWNIDIRTTDGAGLPDGSGTIAQGQAVYDGKCASCHGAKAEGGPMFGTMVGGIGSFTTERRLLTPGSMYPFAPVLFDYVRRAMPLTQPQSLSNDEVYAVTGYILHLNGLLPADAVVNAAALKALKMPNRDGFMVDDRPDTKAVRCMKDCKVLR